MKTRPWSGPLVVSVWFSASSIDARRWGIILESRFQRKLVLVPNE